MTSLSGATGTTFKGTIDNVIQHQQYEINDSNYWGVAANLQEILRVYELSFPIKEVNVEIEPDDRCFSCVITWHNKENDDPNCHMLRLHGHN